VPLRHTPHATHFNVERCVFNCTADEISTGQPRRYL
jgi:hypothetical protein